MCGILCVYRGKIPNELVLTHRGPDQTRVATMGQCYMEFTRLSINDLTEDGMQPFTEDDKMLVCNGEIYNHDRLVPSLDTSSDCGCLIPTIEMYGFHMTCEMIRGVFAIAYVDSKGVKFARDPIGVRPLFYTRTIEGGIAVASEVKALLYLGTKVEIFPPGHMYDSLTDQFTCYYPCYWDFRKTPFIFNGRELFEQAVKRRVENTDREIGVLLSGGLDSSVVAYTVRKILGPNRRIRTFSIGTKDSPDCKAAEVMAKHINSEHTRVDFDLSQGVKDIPDVIESIESYDTTTIRASVPMWTLAKYIKEHTDCRVILSGEGSDELLGGYLYFHNAPSEEEFFMETVRRVKLLHQFDVLRADRCTAAHGLELRVPFLDRDFIDFIMAEVDPGLKFQKGEMEKKVFREWFNGDIPDEILWRKKDAFSDAVGYSWVDAIKDHTDERVSDILPVDRSRFIINKPLTNEELYYRTIFRSKFGDNSDHLISEIWRPKWTDVTDPSARKLK